MKKSGRILILTAIVMLMAHSIIPHQHHGQMPEGFNIGLHKSANSFVEYLKLALHNDLGSNHLEDYYVKHFQFNQQFFELATFNFDFEPTYTYIKQKIFVPYSENHSPPDLLFRIQQRGPPSIDFLTV